MDLFLSPHKRFFFSLITYHFLGFWQLRPQTLTVALPLDPLGVPPLDPFQTEILDPPQRPKSSDFYEILYTTVHLELDASRMTIYEHIQNSRWRTAVILKVIFFDLN